MFAHHRTEGLHSAVIPWMNAMHAEQWSAYLDSATRKPLQAASSFDTSHASVKPEAKWVLLRLMMLKLLATLQIDHLVPGSQLSK